MHRRDRRKQAHGRIAVSVEGQRSIMPRKIKRFRDVRRGTFERCGASCSSAAIIHAEAAARHDAINEGLGIYASAGSCIAARRGRGIRLIILIAPSTPFLCARARTASV